MKQENPNAAMPLECQDALRAIGSDPVNIDVETLEHVSVCRMCSEARVLWLAQDDFDHVQTHAGYFENLPDRILRKLPAQPTGRYMRRPLLASAASLALIAAVGTSIGVGGYLLGRQDNIAPIYFEALNPPRDFQDVFADPTSFSSFELFSQIPDLTPEETSAMMTDLKKPEASFQPAKPEDD